MTRLTLAALVSLGLLALCGCGSPQPATCGPTSCTGCCTVDGQCVSGLTVNACGTNGAACQNCSGIGQCVAGGRCEASTGGGGGATGGGGGGATGGGGGGAAGGGGGAVGGGGAAGGGTGGGVAVGDACSAPIDIVIANGVGAAVGDRTNSADDATGTCGPTGGGDIVYRFTTTSVGTLTVDVRPTDSQQRLATYLRTSCDMAATEVPGACVSAQSAGAGTLLVQRNLAAGTYYLWVDGAGTATGGVNVSLNFVADAGDTCTNAITLPFTGGEANVAGSTAGATNDGTSTCGGTGADVIYRVDVTQVSNFDVTVSPRNVNVQPVVYLRSATCTGAQLGCTAATAAGANASLRLGSLPVGTYYLWVDGATANAGDYALTAHLAPPQPGETCASPKALTFTNGPAGGTASDTGNTTNAYTDATGTCLTGAGADLVYTFTTNTVLDLRATATTTSTTFRPALYLRNATCTGTELACNAATLAGGASSIAVGGLPAGTYYLWVDGAAGTAGDFALAASLTAPLPGESCGNPKPLVFSNGQAGGAAADTGDTTPAFGDALGTCIAGTSGDFVYSFTTNAVLDLRVNATTTSPTYRPALYLRNITCTGTERTCNAATAAGGAASLAFGSLPAGTYFLWVDGAAGTNGAYALSASLTAPALGDTCANPEPLVFSAGLDGGTAADTGDTSTLFHDGVGTCIAGTGGDAVYSFTTGTTLDLRATATTTSSTYMPSLYVRNATCTGVQRTCNTATVAGGSATIASGSLPAGTYYLWVDGASSTAGPYSLAASLTPPVLGEGCGNPKPLVFSAGLDGGTAGDIGDTTLSFDDAVGTCLTGTGNDLVYSFTTGAPKDFSATATTTSGTYRPALYLRNAACTGTERTCNAAAVAGGTSSLNVLDLPAGTYYLWVDGAAGTNGPFSLATSLANAPLEVRALPITPVVAPGPMTLVLQVTNRAGAVQTADSATSFTVSVNGNATFTGATQGTIVSGTGTNSVLVRVANGEIRLTVTDATAQTVTFTPTDSQGLGLVFRGLPFSQTSASQAYPCGATNGTFSFAGVPPVTGPGTVTVTGRGDFNGAASAEYLDVFMESVTGTNLGSVFTAGAGQCSTVDATGNVTAPLPTLQAAIADGTVTVLLRPAASVSCGLCLAPNNLVRVTLSYSSLINGTFQ